MRRSHAFIVFLLAAIVFLTWPNEQERQPEPTPRNYAGPSYIGSSSTALMAVYYASAVTPNYSCYGGYNPGNVVTYFPAASGGGLVTYYFMAPQ
jgi:hypothetical protein